MIGSATLPGMKRGALATIFVAALLASFGLAVIALPAPAYACGDDPYEECRSGGDRRTRGGGPATGGRQGPCVFEGQVIPCSDPDLGWWTGVGRCYADIMDPRPPADFPYWPNGDSSRGAMYFHVCWDETFTMGLGSFVWYETPPGIDPEVVARNAVAKVRLLPPTMGLAPRSDAGSAGLVGLPVWMWTDADPAARTWGVFDDEQVDQGYRVEIRAVAERIVWSMGDGGTVTCTNPGTPYIASYGLSDSPTCGYKYTRSSRNEPGGVFTVTATAYWRITWSVAGVSGVIEVERSATATVRIDELQVITG